MNSQTLTNNSQIWLQIFWETLFCIMKISRRAFLTRSHFSNQSSLKSPLEHETRNAWKFQNLIMPSDYHVFLFFVDHTQTATAHISSSLPQNYCCLDQKVTLGWDHKEYLLPVTPCPEKVEGVSFGKVAKHIPVPHRAIVLASGCPEGWWERREGVAHYIGSPESPRRQHAIWTHSLLINRAALVNRVELNVMIVNKKTDYFNRVSVYFDTLWYSIFPSFKLVFWPVWVNYSNPDLFSDKKRSSFLQCLNISLCSPCWRRYKRVHFTSNRTFLDLFIRVHCTMKTCCNFQNSKLPPSYHLLKQTENEEVNVIIPKE